MEVPLRSILNGFRSTLATGGLEIATFLAIVGGVILLALVGYLVKNARDRQHRRLLAEKLYRRRVAEADLTLEDRRLLDSLVDRLDRPKEQKHHLVADPGLFHRVAARALGDGAASEEAVASLRVSLGLSYADARGLLRSSTEIAEGKTVRLEAEGSEALAARVTGMTSRALAVEAQGAARLPRVGTPLTVALTTEAGSFRFPSEVLGESGRVLSLAHSESVEHVQARRFFRRAVEVSASVRDERTGADISARLLELSGGGASVALPAAGPRAELGQELALRLNLPGEKALAVAARVVRLSGGGSRAHLEFHDLSARSQDRIVEYVLR